MKKNDVKKCFLEIFLENKVFELLIEYLTIFVL